jgi:hypothetical protein
VKHSNDGKRDIRLKRDCIPSELNESPDARTRLQVCDEAIVGLGAKIEVQCTLVRIDWRCVCSAFGARRKDGVADPDRGRYTPVKNESDSIPDQFMPELDSEVLCRLEIGYASAIFERPRRDEFANVERDDNERRIRLGAECRRRRG